MIRSLLAASLLAAALPTMLAALIGVSPDKLKAKPK
jgi:hypothetical protein